MSENSFNDYVDRAHSSGIQSLREKKPRRGKGIKPMIRKESGTMGL